MFLMRVFRRVFAACYLCTTLPVTAQEVLTLQLDRARIVEMPAGTHTLIIGNPSIADATVLKRQNQLVLNARSFGETNMIALDAKGAALAEIILRVRSNDHALIIQRGMERESWSCNPRCEPTIDPGDAARHTGDVISQANRRHEFAQPPTHGATSTPMRMPTGQK